MRRHISPFFFLIFLMSPLLSGSIYDYPDDYFLEEENDVQPMEKKGIKWKCECNRFHDWTENFCTRCEKDSGWSSPYDMYGNPIDQESKILNVE